MKKNVRAVEMLDRISLDNPERMTTMSFNVRLPMAGVEVRTGVTVKRYDGKKVT